MSQTNHIVGGLTVTAVIASLWNINIFSDFNYLVITSIGALLPDIDHTKGLAGKTVYPIAKWLDKKFGHRTITHSLLFLFVCIAIAKIFLPPPHVIILALAISSHLILDMVTIQGVPLFYPFWKNPCVIPGNPDARIRSGDARTELIAFTMFIFIGASCWPLITNGFWMTFNRALATRTQLISEFRRSDHILFVDYSIRRNFEIQEGIGLCLSANKSEIVILDTTTKKLMKIIQTDVVKRSIPSFSPYTSLTEITKVISFSGISLDSFNTTTANTPIAAANIYTSQPVIFNIDGKTKKDQHIDAYNVNAIKIIYLPVEQKNKNKQKLLLSIAQLERKYINSLSTWSKNKHKRDSLEKIYNIATDIQKTEIINELKKAIPPQPDQEYHKLQIEILRSEIKPSPQIKIYGKLKYYNL